MANNSTLIRNGSYLHPLWVILVAILIISAVHILAIILEITPIRNNGRWDIFWDCDSYVWLTRALDFYQYGDWYTPSETYLSYPDPLLMHWTRPLDLILVGGAWLGSLFTDFKTALEIWARILAPLLHITSVIVISLAVKPFLSNRGYLFLILLYALQRGIYNKFSAGQVDNHPLLMLGLIILFALILRYLHHPRRAYLSSISLLAALLTWVSVEAMVLLLSMILPLGLLWLFEHKGWLKVLWRILLFYAVTLSLILLLERPPSQWLMLESDRLSFLQLGVVWILTMICGVINSLDKCFVKTLWQRLLISIAAILVTLLGSYLLYPEFFQGAHPWIHEAVKIMAENQPDELPYLPTDPYESYHFFLDMGPLFSALLLIPIVYRLTPSKSVKRRLILYLGAILVLGSYSLYLYRGLGFSQFIVIFPWLEGMLFIYQRYFQNQSGSSKQFTSFKSLQHLAIIIILIELFSWQWQVAFALNAYYDFRLVKFNDWRQYVKPWCQYNDIVPYMTDNGRGDPNQTILTDLWSGPEVMYKTGYSLFYSPYHRNGEGIHDGFMLTFSHPRDGIGPSIAKKRNLKYIVFCRNFLRYASDSYMRDFPQGLSARLYRGETPSWLEAVPLPEHLQKQFVLFKTRDNL